MSAANQQIIVPFGNERLVLTRDEFDLALERSKDMFPHNVAGARTGTNRTEVLDAKGISEVTGVPASWFLDKARCNEIPYIKAGKYVRFDREEVINILRKGKRS